MKKRNKKKQEDLDNKILRFKTSGRFIQFFVKEIKFCKGDGNYTHIVYLNNESEKKEIISKPIRYFQIKLPEKIFFKSHKSWLINSSRIASFSSKHKYIALNNQIVPISRKNCSIIIERLLNLGIPDINESSSKMKYNCR
jgi:two-component system, LytTR family, response regulator